MLNKLWTESGLADKEMVMDVVTIYILTKLGEFLVKQPRPARPL